MKKEIQIFIVNILAVVVGLSQTNIVPNPTFDGNNNSSTVCVDVIVIAAAGFSDNKAKWTYVPSWDMPDGKGLSGTIPTPDRLCDSPGTIDSSFIPGTGFAQTITLGEGEWELVTTQLSNSTIVGEIYYYEYYIKTGNGTYTPNEVGFNLSKEKPKQKRRIIGSPFKDKTFLDGMLIEIPKNLIINESWKKISGYFYCMDDYDWITLGGFTDHSPGVYLHWTNVQLYRTELSFEDCPNTKLIQDKTLSNVIESADVQIRAGKNVGAPFPAMQDDVIITNGHSIFKAGEEVSLEPGFETRPGANFLAYIAPCSENPCPGVSSLSVNEYEFCDNSPHAISTGFSPAFGHAIKWSPSTYLSADNVVSPTFTPPTSGSNTIEYVVTFTDPCGNVASQIVRVSYTDQGVAPVINMNNLVNQEYELSFDLTMQSQSEWLEIEVKEKQTGNIVYSTGTQYYGSDYGTNESFLIPCKRPGLSVCFDYEVIIRTKNNCYTGIATQTIDWNRSQFCSPKPQILTSPLPNVFTPNGDGSNDQYCIQVCGAENAEITVFNRWDEPIYDVSFPVCSSTVCLWDGSETDGLGIVLGQATAGQYYLDIKIAGCGSSVEPTIQSVTLMR